MSWDSLKKSSTRGSPAPPRTAPPTPTGLAPVDLGDEEDVRPPEPRAGRKKRRAAAADPPPRRVAAEVVDADPVPWEPKTYQLEAAKFMVERGAAGILADPGMGKTAATLAAFKTLRDAGHAERALVVAPLRVCYSVWPAEVAKWSDFADLRVEVVHGPNRTRALTTDADIYVVNPEGLAWLSSQWRGWARRPDVLVVDESTKFKHTRTQRFKTLKPLLPQFERRYILTGTPIPNGLLDLFGQVYLLDLGGTLGKFITHFRNEFFFQTGYGGYTWVARDGAEEEIYERLRPLVLRLDRNDYLDLPPITHNAIAVDLPVDAMRAYRELETDFVLKVKAGEVVASNAGALTAKLRQAANGAVYLDDETEEAADRRGGRRFGELHAAKIDALLELIDELSGQPALVAYEFQHDRARLQKALKKFYPRGDVPYLGGGVSAARGAELEREWNAGSLPVLLVHPASAGHGLNLQAGGHHIAWFGLSYNLEHHDQMIDRLYRQGQNEHVFVHYLVAKRTVDIKILAALRQKDRTQRDLLDALKEAYR